MSSEYVVIHKEVQALTKRWWQTEYRLYACMLAFFLTIVVLFVSGMMHDTFPFGSISRSINDLGNQFVPFHTYYWDLLHGKAEGDMLFNWRSGFGTSFFPDFVTYLSSPFELLIVLFPRSQVNLAIYVITVVKMATAGALMAVYLLTVKRGSWVLAGILGASYALCGWALDDGWYVPMWLDGLIAFPMICLIGEWALSGGRLVTGSFLVALAWIANFYTAYMATLGAAVVVIIRILTANSQWRHRIIGLGRAVVMVLLGIGMATPFLIPIFKATLTAQPTITGVFTPIPWSDLFSRLLPLTEGVGSSPSLFVGTLALLLAFTFIFNRAISPLIRFVWVIAVLAVIYSLQWPPTQLMWHAFSTPNGSSYREAFIMCGFLVIIAWLSVSLKFPSPMSLLGAGIIFVLLIFVTRNSPFLHHTTLPVVGVTLVLMLVTFFLLWYAERKHWTMISGLAMILIVVVFAVEATGSAVVVDQIRQLRIAASPEWGKWHDNLQTQVLENNDWPVYRTEPGPTSITKNDPMLVGGQGVGYYSSLVPTDTVRTVTALGFGWDRWGRGLTSLDNLVTDAIFSIGARVQTRPSSSTSVVVNSQRQDVPPLVTVHTTTPSTERRTTAFANQEHLLGSRVYQVPYPKVRAYTDATLPIRTNPNYVVSPQKGEGSGTYHLETTCKPGSVVYLWVPHLSGTARLGVGEAIRISGSSGPFLAPILELGKVPSSGSVSIMVTISKASSLPVQPIGCLDLSLLHQAIDNLRTTGATKIEASGHKIRAVLPKGSKGTAVFALPRISGWVCSRDGEQATPPRSYMGLIGIPLDGTTQTITCSFRPPGLLIGTITGGLSLLLLLFLGWLDWRRQTIKQDKG
jgi:uncharacterized membrane protein YfhO